MKTTALKRVSFGSARSIAGRELGGIPLRGFPVSSSVRMVAASAARC